MPVSFKINGKLYKLTSDCVPIDTSLNTFIRNYAQLRGTKFMCLEGGCGVCIVSVTGVHPVSKEIKTWAINSCLIPAFACHDLEITTVEGLGNKKDGYHAIQKRLAHLNGTQCGYCSPGMVMNMHSLMEGAKGSISMENIENSFGGNICRCTGYRPILDAFKSLAVDASEELKDLCSDIEDLKICPKTGSKCYGKCNQDKTSISMIFEDYKEWHKVYSIPEIFDILNKNPKKLYMLVAGNTAHGVYRRDPKIALFIDIKSIEELQTYSIGDQVVLGGSTSLTDTMDIFEKAAKSKPEFEYLRQLIKHIDLIANVPVRNGGTIAGNLSIKHQHMEFPSDMYIMLESVGATLTITDSNHQNTEVSIMEFLKIDMNMKLITKLTLPPLIPGKFYFRSYKIMPRAQNAHAYVNAGFLIELDADHKNIVQARICFGGINPDFTHATETEKFLIGKNLYNNTTLKQTLKILKNELNPDWVLPDASPDFRKQLALSLFYKFVLNTCPDDKIKPEYKSGGEILDRELSSGKQIFDTYKPKWPLTEPVTKLEAMIQCSGEAFYANDLPYQPNELWAAYALATKVHYKIVSIDASEALKIPGVVAFFSAKDIPGKNNFSPQSVGYPENEEIFCSGEVLFHGQPAGIIVAETFSIANFAAGFVKILYEKPSEYPSMLSTIWDYMGVGEKEKPILPTLKDVLRENATHLIHETPHNKIATIMGLNAKESLSGHFEMGSQYHFTMETQTCVCLPTDNGLDVYTATQWMDLVQCAISEALNIPGNKINIAVHRLGGGYGAKISRQSQVACAAALACHLLNKPIRFVLTIESNMTTVGKRYACANDYEVDVDENGKIQKLKNDYYEDAGCTLNEDVIANSTRFFKNCYISDSWTINAKAVKTDSPSHTWCRAPGTTEGIAMIENIMEHISRVSKQTRESVRLANMADDHPTKKIYKEFLKSINFEKRRTDIHKFNDTNRWRKRGIATIPMEYFVEYFGAFPALVSIYHTDGTVAITHGGIEMGQGINTKIAQVAAHIFGISLDMIDVKPSNNVAAANSFVSGGSVTSESVAYAVNAACEELMTRMKPVRDSMKNPEWKSIVTTCFMQNIDLTAKHMYKAGDAKTYSVYACSCAEMEVDLLSGNIKLIRVDILEDTGESMSPSIDIGQVEGGFIMGVGYWLTENLVFNRENGELLSNRTWTYKPPGAKDIPIDFRITLLQKSSNPNGVLRSKATGEPSFCMSVVVIFALRYALDSARKDAGLTEWYQLGAPSTPETVFQTSGIDSDQFDL